MPYIKQIVSLVFKRVQSEFKTTIQYKHVSNTGSNTVCCPKTYSITKV